MTILTLNQKIAKLGPPHGYEDGQPPIEVEFCRDSGNYEIIAQSGSCDCVIRLTADEARELCAALQGHLSA